MFLNCLMPTENESTVKEALGTTNMCLLNVYPHVKIF